MDSSCRKEVNSANWLFAVALFQSLSLFPIVSAHSSGLCWGRIHLKIVDTGTVDICLPQAG